ncbi:MAG: NUDIX domain-containing protein [Candidatus Falkowbacteria bacterium]
MHPKPKSGTSSDGRPMHYSVGAVIVKDGKYLLIDRAREPFGFAGVAGHVDEGEVPELAMEREVREESGFTVVDFEYLYEEEVPWNYCGAGVKCHYWYLFICEVEGEERKEDEEAKSMGWYTPEEMEKLTLEPVWKYWFEKMGILEKENQ